MTNNEKQINNILSAIKERGHSRALLLELTLLEANRDELNLKLAQVDAIVPKVIPISIKTIVENIQQALTISDEKQRGIIVREFISKISTQKIDGMLSGEIHINISGVDETIML